MKQNQPTTIEDRFNQFWKDIEGCKGCGSDLLVCKKDYHFLSFIHTELSALLDRVEKEVIGIPTDIMRHNHAYKIDECEQCDENKRIFEQRKKLDEIRRSI